jgi:hypothetical protein
MDAMHPTFDIDGPSQPIEPVRYRSKFDHESLITFSKLTGYEL